MKQEQIYKAALERILFHLKDIYDTDLSTAEKKIRRIACVALGKHEADYILKAEIVGTNIDGHDI